MIMQCINPEARKCLLILAVIISTTLKLILRIKTEAAWVEAACILINAEKEKINAAESQDAVTAALTNAKAAVDAALAQINALLAQFLRVIPSTISTLTNASVAVLAQSNALFPL